MGFGLAQGWSLELEAYDEGEHVLVLNLHLSTLLNLHHNALRGEIWTQRSYNSLIWASVPVLLESVGDVVSGPESRASSGPVHRPVRATKVAGRQQLC